MTLLLLLHALFALLLVAWLAQLLALAWILRNRVQSRSLRRKQKQGTKKVIAFFHPYCSAGGGGERVLWKIIEVLGDLYAQGFALEVLIYTVDPPSQAYKDGTFLVCGYSGVLKWRALSVLLSYSICLESRRMHSPL